MSLELFERIPATIYLALVGVVLSLIIAVPLGTIAAVKRNTFVDYISQTVSLFGISIPEFWFAIMCDSFLRSTWAGCHRRGTIVPRTILVSVCDI